MIYHVLASLVAFVFPSFYRRVQIRNATALKTPAPAIIAINHPNAFADPVGLCFIMYPQRFWFLARGDVFKPGLVSWFFDRIGIIPIFRLMDGGKEGLSKNDATYRRVNHHLKKGEKVIVFAEGLCIMERRLRPLKKGVARMVFGAYEELQNPDLLVIPVGVNYSQPDRFGSTLFYNVGEPLRVHDFLKERDPNNARAQKSFLELLEPRLKALITHIENPRYDELVLQAEELFKLEDIRRRRKDPRDLGNEFDSLQHITHTINLAAKSNPEALEQFREKSAAYFRELKLNGLRDWLVREHMKEEPSPIKLLLRSLLLLIGLPYFVFSWLLNILPHALSEHFTKKLVRTKEFYASFFIAFSLVFHLFYYLSIGILAMYVGPAYLPVFLFMLVLMLGNLYGLNYIPFYKKTLGLYRIWKKPGLLNALRGLRKELSERFNTL